MNSRMIVFDRGQVRFNYRVGAIVLHGQRVLLQGVEGEEFWTLPGGRGELLEPAREALAR